MIKDVEEKYSFAATPPAFLAKTTWSGHIPFAFEIIKALEPETVVELGVWGGCSFFAFCQAAETLKLKSKCYGIDTWQGDVHMGQYSERVFEKVQRYSQKHYSDRAILIRKTFCDAFSDFKDGSIDLLHIDGTHTYDAVSEDFRIWLPKISERGVVLFHDVSVIREDFGVKRFFDSIKPGYVHFEFEHSCGLGVLVVGKKAPLSVLQMSEDAANAEFMEYFRRQGERIYVLIDQKNKGVFRRLARSLKRILVKAIGVSSVEKLQRILRLD
jgi:hypothetical protein